MTPALLDINDCNLQLWHTDMHLASPGFALLADAGYTFGNAALRTARLKPREVHTRYWWQLGTEALQPAFGAARHTADLVHAHLNTLYEEGHRPAEVLLSVPGSMQRDQLSLLLGIVEASAFNAVGLVHRSALLASLYAPGGAMAHLELQLHQAVLTQLEPEGDDLTVARSSVLPGVGMLQLQERLVDVTAAAFVRQTRFDPRRQAATEQQLYDALPQALRDLRGSGEANIEINGYSAHLERQDVASVAQPLYDSAAKYPGLGPLIADPLVGLLPGLDSALPGTEVLDSTDLQDAMAQQSSHLVQRGQALDFVTRLPALSLKAASDSAPVAATPFAAAEPAPAPPPPATHLLQGHVARELVQGMALAGGWQLLQPDGQWELGGSGPAVTVNGDPAGAGQVLLAGDSLVIADEPPATLIRVEA